MNWLRKKDYSYRHPKIYYTTPRESKGIYLSGKIKGLIFIVLILGLILWILFGSGYFQVKNIIIKGSLNPEVQQEIESLRGKNILTFVLGNIEEKLTQKQSSIKSINILRGLPDTLKIDVTVRKPLITWKSQDKIYLIDEEGVAFEQGEGMVVTEEGTKLPLVVDSSNMPVETGKHLVTADFVDFIVELIKMAPEKVELNIGEIRVGETTFNIEADTDKGFKIKLDTTRSLSVQLDVLRKILTQYGEQIHEYVDLRVEGRVYYK